MGIKQLVPSSGRSRATSRRVLRTSGWWPRRAKGVQDQFATTHLNTLLTALCVKIDDRLADRPRMGRAPQLTDAELVALAVAQALLGFTSEARRLRFLGRGLHPGRMRPIHHRRRRSPHRATTPGPHHRHPAQQGHRPAHHTIPHRLRPLTTYASLIQGRARTCPGRRQLAELNNHGQSRSGPLLEPVTSEPRDHTHQVTNSHRRHHAQPSSAIPRPPLPPPSPQVV